LTSTTFGATTRGVRPASGAGGNAERPSAAMARVVSGVVPTLAAAGFKKRRHAFNCVAEPGLVHVVTFQMGQFPIGAYEIPGLRPNLYGKFTVNLGVFVREVYEATLRRPAPAFAQEYDCEFRTRLSEVSASPSDRWWSLDIPVDQLVAELAEELRARAIPWFSQYATRDAILGIPSRDARPPGWPLRASVALAVMLVGRGDRSGARTLLREYLIEERRNPRNPRHRDWVVDLAARLGFATQDIS